MTEEMSTASYLEEHKNEFERSFREGGSHAAKTYVRKNLDQWKTTPLNIGVTGRSGVGKSTLINTIRRLEGDRPGAAPTGVKETTCEAKAYPHPDNKKLVFWDLPGIGTKDFPKETYFKDERVEFDKYDMFLILSSDRFFVDDSLLVKKVQENNKSFVFIRTKVDVAIECQKRAAPSTFEKNKNKFVEDILSAIRADVVKGMGENSPLETCLFLIDCLDMTEYDFEKLLDKLIDGLDGYKREVFIMSLMMFHMRQSERKS